jgi:checkpoint serine/threonine-protein kinase
MDPSRSTLPSTSRRDAQQLSRQRQQYRDQLYSKYNEDDPLSAYDQFIQWTIQNYGEEDPESGLFELLEETTVKFKKDSTYKNDLRYLKIWSLYAHQVEKPATIYAFLIANEIGTMYSALYEEYANVLERDGR